jgi:hypothetical protein
MSNTTDNTDESCNSRCFFKTFYTGFLSGCLFGGFMLYLAGQVSVYQKLASYIVMESKSVSDFSPVDGYGYWRGGTILISLPSATLRIIGEKVVSVEPESK